jgi:hypothetical protein
LASDKTIRRAIVKKITECQKIISPTTGDELVGRVARAGALIPERRGAGETSRPHIDAGVDAVATNAWRIATVAATARNNV